MLINNIQILKKVNTPMLCFSNTNVLESSTMNMTYGERLRAARKHKGWSQDVLAKRSGVGQGTISQIERGDQETSVYDIELALALDISAIWLKKGNPDHEPDWLKTPGEKPLKKEARLRIDTILDAADDAMYESGLNFSDDEKLKFYLEAFEFTGSKRFSPKLITAYLLETIKDVLKKEQEE